MQILIKPSLYSPKYVKAFNVLVGPISATWHRDNTATCVCWNGGEPFIIRWQVWLAQGWILDIRTQGTSINYLTNEAVTYRYLLTCNMWLSYVHKECPQSGRICPERTFCRQGEGFFWCKRPHFLVQKLLDFSKLMVCPHGQGKRGMSQCGHFSDKGRGQFFSWLCVDVFYGWPLIKLYSNLHNQINIKKPTVLTVTSLELQETIFRTFTITWNLKKNYVTISDRTGQKFHDTIKLAKNWFPADLSIYGTFFGDTFSCVVVISVTNENINLTMQNTLLETQICLRVQAKQQQESL